MTAERRDPSAKVRPVYPLIRLGVALLLMTLGGSAMFATIVALQPVGREFDVGRGLASVPYMLFMAGFGFGGVAMGRLADRFGIMLPALITSLALPAGMVAAAYAENLWQFCLAVGLLAGFFGASTTFAPLVADISHWFTARRGLAVGIVICGSYLAGAIWPPVLQHYIDSVGWRQTFIGFGVLNLLILPPLALCLWRRPVIASDPPRAAAGAAPARPLQFGTGTLQCLICAAGIGCCAAMAMPQVHIVPYATEFGHAPARAAEMLSLMLGFGIVSRLVSGWISDRIGGLKTLLLGSTLQALVLAAFMTADSLTSFYLVSIAFGLSQGGIVPSYAIIIRRYFPARDAGWRIGLTLLFTVIGMALGGWMAGALYDLTGSYTVSFLNAIAFNIMNMAIAALLLKRGRNSAGGPRPASSAVG